MSTTKIDVSKCDNELILIASTGAGSSTLCHLKSGYNAPVSYEFNPAHVLPSGTYTLEMIGINWGGPGKWAVTVTTNGQKQTYSHSSGDTFWTEKATITV